MIEDDNLLENIRARGDQLSDLLNARFGQHPNVGNIRGRGLFWTVELVRNKADKAPFPASAKLAPRVQKAALDLGLMCYPAQGCADGSNGDHVLLAPAYTSTPEEIAQIVDLVAEAIETALQATEK